MAKKQRSGKSFKYQYGEYKAKAKWRSNRLRDLQNHVKHFPQDLQAAEILKQGRPIEYRRARPKHRGLNKGIPVYNKFTQKIDRLVLNKDLFPPKTSIKRPESTVEQFFNLGIIQIIPKRYIVDNEKSKGKHTSVSKKG